MISTPNIARKLSALLIYGRPPLVFGGMLCALAVMWNRSHTLYITGVLLLLLAMSFDLVAGWLAARYPPHPTLFTLTDRVMDKIVYAIIFPLVAMGMMWRLVFIAPDHSRFEMLHAIVTLILCITVLIRDSFAHFIRTQAAQKSVEPETMELTRLRTMAAAPVGALLYIHAFYMGEPPMPAFCTFISWLANLPLRAYLIIEIIFLIINFGSIAALCRKYGNLCLDEVCHDDDLLRRQILAFFPNTLTLLNGFMGLLAVFFAHQGLLRQAYLLLIGAAIFDKLDGSLARRLGLTEYSTRPDQKIPFGAVLDDIADGISFCLAPALIFHLTMSPVINQLVVSMVSGLYLIMGIARLIYFTVDREPVPGFFKGMPTPAAALLVVAPLLLFGQTGAEFWIWAALTLMLIASLAMNLYPVHYIHLGRFMDTTPWFKRLNIILLFVFLFTDWFGYVALSYLLLYLMSPAVSRRLEPGLQ